MAANYATLNTTQWCALDEHNFGPRAHCRGWDFTLFFEQSVFSIAPQSLLLVLAFVRICYLRRSDVKTLPLAQDSLLRGKAWAILSFAALRLTILVLWSTNPSIRTRASLPAAVLSFVGALSLFPLSYVEHTRSIRPSTLTVLFFFLSLLCDIPQVRTLHLIHGGSAIVPLLHCTIVARLWLIIVELQDKRRVLKSPYNEYPCEATAGLFRRILLLWLNSLFVRGCKRILTLDDLDTIHPTLSSELLRDKMQREWDQRGRPESPRALLWQTLRCLKWPILRALPFRMCMIGFYQTQPLLFGRLIKYVVREDESRDEGLSLAMATAVVYMGYSISHVLYQHQLNLTNAMIRGALIGVIFNKALVLDDASVETSAAVALISTDIDRIAESYELFIDVGASTIRLIICTLLVVHQLKWTWTVPMILLLIIAFIPTAILSRQSNEYQKAWSKAIERRIDMTGSMLGHMTGIRMMGLAGFMTATVHNLRASEIRKALRCKWLENRTTFLSHIPLDFGPILTFAVYQTLEKYSRGDHTAHFSSSQVFTTIAIIELMAGPFHVLSTSVPVVYSCMGSFERIQNYLTSPSREDRRIRSDAAGSPLLSEKKLPDLDFEFVLDGISVQRKADFAIKVTNLTVRPARNAKPVLFDINMQLRGGINFLAGPAGSGKSTLMRAILGELSFEKGCIHVTSSEVAYCSQTPWLIDASIREIICGASDLSLFDENWYEEVKIACALVGDIARLPNFDKTMVGTRGMALSGGQRQRLTLARAVYARKKIILLDDVLSALDSKTEALIVRNLLGPEGLLRTEEITVLLITHTTTHFHLADHIVFLGDDGKISQQGSFQELKDEVGSLKDHIGLVQRYEELKTPPGFYYNHGTKLQVQIDVTRRRGDKTIYKYYADSIRWLALFLFVSSAALFTVAENISPFWFGFWVRAKGKHLEKYIPILVALAILRSVFRCTTWGIMFLYIFPNHGRRLHSVLLKTTMSAPQTYFARIDTGTTLNRFSQDLSIIDRDIPEIVGMVILATLSCVAQAVTVIIKFKYMILPLLIMILLVYGVQRTYLFTSRQVRLLDIESRGPVYSHLLEIVEGLSTIRAFGWQDLIQAEHIKRLDRSQRAHYLLRCIRTWLSLVLDILVALLAMTAVVLPVSSGTIRKTCQGSSLGIVLLSLVFFTDSIRNLVENWTWLETSMGAMSRIRKFAADVAPENKSWEKETPPLHWPNHGHIEFREVCASYGPAALALNGISLSVMPGQRIVFCGPSGSGKSSLLLTLLRLLEIDSGSISIDGIDLQTIPRETVRSSLIVIPQNPFVFDLTVRQNADPAGLHPDHLIIEALTRMKLWDLISGQGGLDAEMKSQPLSQGQQQMFCLARALLKKREGGAKVLILDEATSNVDAQTDQLMQLVVREEFGEHTILIVAHRLDAIVDADRVAVLEGGRVVEFGEPGELLAMEDSRFRSLYSRRR